MSASTKTKSRMFRTQVNLPAEKREELIALLNTSVATVFDLYSQTKQAHWNVKGAQFYQLHELFDELAGEVIGFVDELAERAVALGGTAMGTARMAGHASILPEYPADAVEGKKHVALLVERYGIYANHLRAAIDQADELGDKGTSDLYTGMCRTADKQTWFLEAHLQDKE